MQESLAVAPTGTLMFSWWWATSTGGRERSTWVLIIVVIIILIMNICIIFRTRGVGAFGELCLWT